MFKYHQYKLARLYATADVNMKIAFCTSPNLPPPILFSNSTADLGISQSVLDPCTDAISGHAYLEVPHAPWKCINFSKGSLPLVASDSRFPEKQ